MRHARVFLVLLALLHCLGPAAAAWLRGGGGGDQPLFSGSAWRRPARRRRRWRSVRPRGPRLTRTALPPTIGLLETVSSAASAASEAGGEGAAGAAGTAAEPLALGRYPGQPSMQYDGTEGNGAYYAGNFNPGSSDLYGEHNQFSARGETVSGAKGSVKTQGSFAAESYWQHSPYYTYFKKVWGNAPFLDANFRMWSEGFFKNFHLPRAARPYQQTKALPAFLHFYGKTYDPLIDHPYNTEFDLFGQASAAGEGGAQSGSEATPEANGETIKEDCSQTQFGMAQGYKRPCGVNEKLAKSWTKAKMMLPLNDILGKNTQWEGQRVGAGLARGSRYFTYGKVPDSPVGEGEKPWIGLDDTWASGDGEGRPKNMPPPPQDPGVAPEFRIGAKKAAAEGSGSGR
jgi:hypothetical protein